MRKAFAIFLVILSCTLISCGDTAATIPEAEVLVAHAGGAVYGFKLTNSLEALDEAYENGFRLIELDFEVTVDGEYVLIHDFESMGQRMLFREGRPTLDEFQSADTFIDLTLLDLSELVKWVSKHKDCYIITDAKCGNFPFLEQLYDISGEYAGNFIPQAYSYEEYEAVKSIGYERVILTLYRMAYVSTDELIDFAKREEPFGITVSYDRFEEGFLASLSENGVRVFAHTVNDLAFFEAWRDKGLFGIYTDYFVPSKWPY